MKTLLALVVGAGFLLCAQTASAVTITNGSFEDPTVSDPFVTLGAGSGDLPGWTIGGAGVDHIGSYWQASSGSHSLDLSALSAGSISQDLTDLSIGQQYTVSFDMAGNSAGGNAVKSLQVSIGAGLPSTYTFDTTGSTLSSMGWAAQTFIFVASAATQTLSFLSLEGNPFGAALDNISIAATPIPGALLLFGTALGGMGFLGYRRKKLEAIA